MAARGSTQPATSTRTTVASTKSPSGVRSDTHVYASFQGLDVNSDITGQDNPEAQTLHHCLNASCDLRGQIVRDAAGKRLQQDADVRHVRFFGTSKEGDVVWVSRADNALSLRSSRNHELLDVYDPDAVVTSTIFNAKVHFCSRGEVPVSYDGLVFRENPSKAAQYLAPAYVCAVQRRLCIAGLTARPTEVQLSRVDDYEVFGDDEDANDENVLRGGSIDIGNMLGTADEIMGVASFEQNRLAIFCRNRTFIYIIDPDIDNWRLDERANINIGTISHNTIVQAGQDLLFCSERGVHSIQRSRDNGILVYSMVMSRRVDILYRELLRAVPDPSMISAVWDHENARFHIFFPTAGDKVRRLSLTIFDEQSEVPPKWSEGDYLNAVCGDVLGGRMVWGGRGGVYEILDPEDDGDELYDVDMRIETPVLWHKSMMYTKYLNGFFLHASGEGELLTELLDEHDRCIHTVPLRIERSVRDHRFEIPLADQYERKAELAYRGLRVRLTNRGKGLLRIMALGFITRKNP